MGVTVCQLDIIMHYAKDTEVEQLKSEPMMEELTEVSFSMLAITEFIYNHLVVQEIWVVSAMVVMADMVDMADGAGGSH